MKMQERLAQRSKARNPHAGRRKGVHPGDQANTVLRLVGVQAQLLNRLAAGQHRLRNDLHRHLGRCRQPTRNGGGVFLYLLERFRSVEMLAPSDKPSFQIGKIDHVVPLKLDIRLNESGLVAAGAANSLSQVVLANRDGKRFPRLYPLGCSPCIATSIRAGAFLTPRIETRAAFVQSTELALPPPARFREET